ncbi:hypothetical protein DVH24_034421 [Malus domestica]|uniref:Uncharacterized protein n=1 Tax=Malus domestica TaxID=3750 RepID=A0A498J270_MALDO|nr:hypothetical protein DVH24_034421 [Malus domestica]
MKAVVMWRSIETLMASWKSNHEAPYTSSGEHRPFRGHFRPNHEDLADVQVSGDLRGFRGIFRSNHGELHVHILYNNPEYLICGVIFHPTAIWAVWEGSISNMVV